MYIYVYVIYMYSCMCVHIPSSPTSNVTSSNKRIAHTYIRMYACIGKYIAQRCKIITGSACPSSACVKYTHTNIHTNPYTHKCTYVQRTYMCECVHMQLHVTIFCASGRIYVCQKTLGEIVQATRTFGTFLYIGWKGKDWAIVWKCE